ncbi:hypothetical protein F4703DRAFT_1794121 [Phycomyces blakesleeanus]
MFQVDLLAITEEEQEAMRENISSLSIFIGYIPESSKSCSLCEKTFKDHWNLKRHLQRCHDITETVADDMSIVQETEYQDIQTSDSPKNPLTPSESVEEESDVDNEYYNSILNYDECEESDDGSRVDNSDFDVEENTEPNASIPLFNHILNNILDVTLSDSTKVTVFLNLPSEHIKLLAADPIKSKSIFSLPDRTPNQSVCLQQGEKWRTNTYFQQPMFTHNNVDFWSGDIVLLKDCSPNIRFLVESFDTMDTSNVFSCGYIVRTPKDGCSIGIEINHTDINIESFLSVDTTPLNTSLCCSISPDTIISLIPTHRKLLEEEHFLKRLICDGTDQENNRRKYYKVKIAPVILFSDDTSGNTSKQFNPYESWSMKCAALSFEERCSIENILFISAIPKKKGANAASLLPEIVDDLKKLENGVVMFSAEDNAYVLVVSPLLWIEADTPCHSELCGLGAPNSTYPCRKCYIKLQSRIPKLNEVEYYTNRHPTRTKDHYIQAASTPDRDTVIPDIPYFDDKNTAEELSFKNKSTDKLLELKAYDQSKDTPAEILHYILLGIAKYLITDLVKVVLNKNKKELEELFDYVKDYKNSRGISRAFTRSLTHAGSFLGRDFKVLIQILPVILAIKFADTEVLQEITPLFVRLGRLCSLVFVRSIDSQYETYISEVDSAVRSLIEALHKYDTNCKHKKHAFYMSKPKVHLLTHLPEDLRRFGPALNYETEKGEQFNKHIREHLFHTNRMNTSKDICLKFGKQYMTRHIIDGGSWIGKNGLRETRGKAIAEYMQQNSDGKFHETLLGGSREFADNNSTGLTPGRILKDNTFALFRQSNGHIIIGMVLFSKVYHLYIEYPSAHAVNNNYRLALKYADDIYTPLDELKVVCLLDMHLKVGCKYVVNLNKFGSYWSFLYSFY